jgi:hypothetical protein
LKTSAKAGRYLPKSFSLPTDRRIWTSEDKSDIDSTTSSDEESGEESGEESDEESDEESAMSAAAKVKKTSKEVVKKGSGNGKRKQANDCSDEEEDNATDESNLGNTVAKPTGVAQDNPTLPPSPSSAAHSKETRLAFLRSLSDDKHYRQLLHLLYAAKVSEYGPSYLPLSVC